MAILFFRGDKIKYPVRRVALVINILLIGLAYTRGPGFVQLSGTNNCCTGYSRKLSFSCYKNNHGSPKLSFCLGKTRKKNMGF